MSHVSTRMEYLNKDKIKGYF